jgi:hypothetical protein
VSRFAEWFLIFGKPKAAFPPPPPVALLLTSPAAVPVSRFAEWFLISGKPKAAFPPPPPVASLLASPAAVPISRCAVFSDFRQAAQPVKLVHRFLNNCAFGIACAMISSWHGSLNLFCCKLMKLFTLNHCFDAELWKTVSQEDAELCCSRHKA